MSTQLPPLDKIVAQRIISLATSLPEAYSGTMELLLAVAADVAEGATEDHSAIAGTMTTKALGEER